MEGGQFVCGIIRPWAGEGGLNGIMAVDALSVEPLLQLHQSVHNHPFVSHWTVSSQGIQFYCSLSGTIMGQGNGNNRSRGQGRTVRDAESTGWTKPEGASSPASLLVSIIIGIVTIVGPSEWYYGIGNTKLSISESHDDGKYTYSII